MRQGVTSDPYEVLGLEEGSDAQEVRTAYRRLAKIYHPDVNSSPDAAAQMARINWAYRVAMEHARRERPRYRADSNRTSAKSKVPRWYVQQRPAPQGGKLIVETELVVLRGQRGENANVEGMVQVRNDGIGPLEGDVRGAPSFVIVRPKQFTLQPDESQMFRVSIPNRYCGPEPSEASIVLESNGGNGAIRLTVPAAADVLLYAEPNRFQFGEVPQGILHEARMKVTYRGPGLQRITAASSATWAGVSPIGHPHKTQFFRLLVRAPRTVGPHHAAIAIQCGDATVTVPVEITVVPPPPRTESDVSTFA